VILCAAVEGDTVVPGRDLPANVTFKFISGGVNDSESLVNGISCRGETEHLYVGLQLLISMPVVF
jgi:hypothetical protein